MRVNKEGLVFTMVTTVCIQIAPSNGSSSSGRRDCRDRLCSA